MYSATPHLPSRQLPRNAYVRTPDRNATSPEHHTLPGHDTRPASLSALLLALFGVACLAWAFIQRGQAESSAAMAAEAPEPTHAQSEEMMRFGEAELPDAPLPKWALSPDDEDYPHVRQEAVEYRIQSGDTLGRIGQRFGCTVPQLMQANQLRSERILAGKKLTIPVCDAQDPLPKPEQLLWWQDAPSVDRKTLPELMRAQGFTPPKGFKAFVLEISFNDDRSQVVRERAFDWKGSSDDVEGWNPASTVKLFATIAALQRIDEQGFSPAAQVTFQGKRSRTHSVKELIDAAIVKSDNLAYNRLVQLAGFDRLNGAFLNERNGIRNSALSRAYEQSEWLKLGESASFRNAPAISFSEGKRSALREASSGSYTPFCSRAACTTLQDLAEAMRRVMLQEYLPQHQSFELSPDSLAILRRALRAERARGNEVVDAFSAVFADGDVQFYSKPGYSEGWYSDTVFISDPHRRQAWVVAMAGYPGRHSLDEAARTVATLLATGQLAEYER